MDSIVHLLEQNPLHENEQYFLYVLRPDGWPFGLHGSYCDVESVASAYRNLAKHRSVIGLWITKESGDGTVDLTVLRKERTLY